MSVYYLTGARFRHAIIAGTEAVIHHQQAINDINVFPVPDKDTGTNMALTLRAIAQTAKSLKTPTLGEVSQAIANSAMMNARGNSGTIVAQFFYALSKELQGKIRVTLSQFSQSVNSAIGAVRSSLTNPADGTILTVMEDWADYIKVNHQSNKHFDSMIPKSLETIQRSLKATKTKLAALEKADVVDAGAQGFTYFMQGVTQYIHDGARRYSSKIKQSKVKLAYAAKSISAKLDLAQHDDECDINYQFCTECIICGPDATLVAVREMINDWGDSTLVIGEDGFVKIHIHTNGPDVLFEKLKVLGDIVKSKYDDMWLQYRDSHHLKTNADIAIITDTSACLPQEFIVKHNVFRVPMQISFDNAVYADTHNIHTKNFYERLMSQKEQVKTSQPTPGDFLRIFKRAQAQTKTAIAVFASSQLSGTLRAAQLAAELMPDYPIHIIDSKSTGSGLGLAVQVAAEAIARGESVESIVHTTEESVRHNFLFSSQRTIDYFVRGGRISRPAGKIAKFFNILPIISIDREGKALKAGYTRGVNANRKRTLEMVKQKASEYRSVRFLIAQAHAADTAKQLAEDLKKSFSLTHIDIVDAMPALGAHAGPGTIAIAMIGKV